MAFGNSIMRFGSRFSTVQVTSKIEQSIVKRFELAGSTGREFLSRCQGLRIEIEVHEPGYTCRNTADNLEIPDDLMLQCNVIKIASECGNTRLLLRVCGALLEFAHLLRRLVDSARRVGHHIVSSPSRVPDCILTQILRGELLCILRLYGNLRLACEQLRKLWPPPLFIYNFVYSTLFVSSFDTCEVSWHSPYESTAKQNELF
ncbi:unnamed protein product [Albugo candida]|uniref:Uncharacterized protein n=1 Tax=Albugo candida TaxID=65357 RepID=A0A024G0Q3_9STRA|nr:unnamed protein product [Albugo candida]CCI49989.1 unnamed protein product [Albugo candida]|eukprot:CCI40344.1 unnamed protein product [Albugo candida]